MEQQTLFAHDRIQLFSYLRKGRIIRLDVPAFIRYTTGILHVLLISRFVLRVQHIPSDSGLAKGIYTLTDPLMQPVLDIFRVVSGSEQETTALLFWSTLLALLVYGLVAYGIGQLFDIMGPLDQDQVEDSSRQDVRAVTHGEDSSVSDWFRQPRRRAHDQDPPDYSHYYE